MAAALLAWCDARHRGGRVLLRLEDLDPQRSRRRQGAALAAALAWLGLDFDAVVWQSAAGAAHQAALVRLAAAGHVYACGCSRAALRAAGGGSIGPYRGTCRGRTVAPAGLAACPAALRVRLPDGPQPLLQLGPLLAPCDPAATTGDPVVRRRDGAIAYMLAGVVDDAAHGVTDVVRGRDLAGCAAPQAALRALLGLRQVTLRHHPLLCDGAGRKLAKSAGDGERLGPGGAAPAGASGTAARAACGWLGSRLGLIDDERPCTPRDLLAAFAWERVIGRDVLLADGGRGAPPLMS